MCMYIHIYHINKKHICIYRDIYIYIYRERVLHEIYIKDEENRILVHS